MGWKLECELTNSTNDKERSPRTAKKLEIYQLLDNQIVNAQYFDSIYENFVWASIGVALVTIFVTIVVARMFFSERGIRNRECLFKIYLLCLTL